MLDMKKINFLLCFLLVVAVIALFIGCESSVCRTSSDSDYLRIHIRANSNSDADQQVKLSVRDEVVKFLSPLLREKKSVEEAKKTVINNKDKIEALSDRVLEKNGFTYKCVCSVKREVFPTRSYGDITLSSGEYDAVIINLGEGSGDNWWCVAYPPLCFVGEGDGEISYRSFLLEWWKRR